MNAKAGCCIIEETIGGLLLNKGQWLAITESCTGGLISHRITNIPGSSRYFKGSIVAYSNDVKYEILSVSPETLKRYGAVSAETATEMATGVRRRIRADIGLSATGIAGPSGGTEEKPIGTVFIAVCNKKGAKSYRFQFKGSREKIKVESADKALEILKEFLSLTRE
jgi:PncC family amidohydrolase